MNMKKLTLCLLGMCMASQVTYAGGNLKYAGVNLPGASYGAKIPGNINYDYHYPSSADYQYFSSNKMNIVRIPFLWERLQKTTYGALDSGELAQLKMAVLEAKKNNMYVILDMHDYAKYTHHQHQDNNGNLVDDFNVIGSKDLAVSAYLDVWAKLAREFKNDNNVIFGIMNEPIRMSSAEWGNIAQQAVTIIREQGAGNLILVPGTGFDSASLWESEKNGDALKKITDPNNNIAFEIHMYMDDNSSGTHTACVGGDNIGVERLKAFSSWLQANNKVGFLGEFAGGDNPGCTAAINNVLNYINANDSHWAGWTYWYADAWSPNNEFNIHPSAAKRSYFDSLVNAAGKITNK